MAGLIIFITVATFATLLCIATTTVCITEYSKQKHKNEEEIEHLREEINPLLQVYEPKSSNKCKSSPSSPAGMPSLSSRRSV